MWSLVGVLLVIIPAPCGYYSTIISALFAYVLYAC